MPRLTDFFNQNGIALNYFRVFIVLIGFITGCQSEKPTTKTITQPQIPILGADLSYVNEIEDCGAYFTAEGDTIDPYSYFAERGANVIRLRLWHAPVHSPYSNFKDVKKSITRAHEAGVAVLLDFHYSDFWADPHKQVRPKAWAGITDDRILADSIYNYTFETLASLAEENLLPQWVQVGNETNIEILQPLDTIITDTINWSRNAMLLNSGLKAVSDAEKAFSSEIKSVLHIAQPENALSWFRKAEENRVTDFDIIGLSYYSKWSTYPIEKLSIAIDSLKTRFKKEVVIVETAYPYSLDNADAAGNILGEDALIEGYPATHEGQKNYMLQLTQNVLNAGGLGVIYWEPAWVTSSCSTPWGTGSHWDNATFFDASKSNTALPVFEFFDEENYSIPTE
ncbi:arabinogalactan endo-1,4-beta-galactosidase [Leeuwenhoekiella nanhaiensis]|uniref:Arabinogalactan endo-beta-1,4-galactanase n=1 Tax=Leeuwenhoekiella nanhaiensis TaxID=1655491 RepID=A0A2G1VT95_9FLAO|nr:arabinogalactan endo-1,4-beta-galactosidase [Leeuwenhoekiella nanhaiensis]